MDGDESLCQGQEKPLGKEETFRSLEGHWEKKGLDLSGVRAALETSQISV